MEAKDILFKNGPSPASFTFIFALFQVNITNFKINQCEKCPSSIRCWDLNPWPSENKSPPITTKPGLSPSKGILFRAFQSRLQGHEVESRSC